MNPGHAGFCATHWGAACWRALPALVWMALIFAFSAQPDLPRVPRSLVDLLVKKAAHTAEYAILAVLILRTWVPATGGLTRNPLLIT